MQIPQLDPGRADVTGVPSTPLRPSRSPGPRSGGLVTDGRLPSTYNFLRPAKLAREHLRTLNMLYETFAHRLAVLLTYNLRVVCRVTPTAVLHSSTEEHVASVDLPTVVVPLTIEPLPGIALLELARDAAMVVVEHLLGGNGDGQQPQRPLSEIEMPLMRDLLTEMLGELREAFVPVEDLKPALGAIEYDPQLVQWGGPADPVVVATFELVVGDSVSMLTLCLPLPGLLPVLQRYHDNAALTASARAARQAARELLSTRLEDVPVELQVRFDSVNMQPTELLRLRPGDVVPLSHPTDRPLELAADGLVFGHAVAAKRGNRLAAHIVSTVREETQA